MLTVSPCYYICDLSLTSLIAQLVKNPPAMRGDPVLILGSRRSPGEGIGYPLQYSWVSLVAQLVKNLPAMQETWIRSLGWEDPLKKEMATHSSIHAWRIPWTEEPGGLVYRVAKSQIWLSNLYFHFADNRFLSQVTNPASAKVHAISALSLSNHGTLKV